MAVDRAGRDRVAEYLAARIRGEHPPRCEVPVHTGDPDLENLGRLALGLVDPSREVTPLWPGSAYWWDVVVRVLAFLRSQCERPHLCVAPRKTSMHYIRGTVGFLLGCAYMALAGIAVEAALIWLDIRHDWPTLVVPGIPVALTAWYMLFWSDKGRERRQGSEEYQREITLARPWPFATQADYAAALRLIEPDRLPPPPGPYEEPRQRPTWVHWALAPVYGVFGFALLLGMWPLVAVALGVGMLWPKDEAAIAGRSPQPRAVTRLRASPPTR